MKIIALVNPLGGTGKTLTAYALSCGLAMRGFKVLAVDAEWQNKLSELCGVDPKDKRTITYLMKNGPVVSDEVLHSVRDGLTIIPSDLDLLRTRMEYNQTALKRALEIYDAQIDFCIIDSPPYNGPWMESVLTAAHKIIVSAQSVSTGFEALLFELLNTVKLEYNPALEVDGFLYIRANPENENYTQAKEKLKQTAEKAGSHLYETEIRPDVQTASALWRKQDVFSLYPESDLVVDYAAFVDEFLLGETV